MSSTIDPDALLSGINALVTAEKAAAAAAYPTTKPPTTIKAAQLLNQAAATARAAGLAALAKAIIPGPVTPPAPTPPPAPAGLKVVGTATGLALTWQPVSAADGYNVWDNGVQVGWPRVSGGDGAPMVLNADGSFTYTHTGGYNVPGSGLTPGSVHSITVQSYSGAGPGPMSAPVSGTVGTTPVPVPPPAVGKLLLGDFAYDQSPAVSAADAAGLGVAGWDLALVHTDMTSWQTLTSNWFASMWRGKGKRMMITFCPFPSGGTLAQAASGAYVTYWQTMLDAIKVDFPDAFLRFAHEQNCCYPWAAAGNMTAYLAMWRLWAGMARKTSSTFVRVWNPMDGSGSSLPEASYPGDDVVDATMLDLYGRAGMDPITGDHCAAWIASFGKAHGKPVGLCESNPATYPGTPSASDNDDPSFINKVGAWVKDPNSGCWVYVTYNDDNGDVRSSLLDGTKPLSAQAFRGQWASRAGIEAWADQWVPDRPDTHAKIVDHNSPAMRASYALQANRYNVAA